MSSHTHTPTFRGTTDDDQSLDDVYGLLSDERRRASVAVLADRGDEIELSRLASAVAERIGDESADPSAETVDRMRISLHHCHLPKLAEAGLIAYDVDRRIVYPTELSDADGPADLVSPVE